MAGPGWLIEPQQLDTVVFELLHEQTELARRVSLRLPHRLRRLRRRRLLRSSVL